MTFIRNCWYPAIWSDELTEQPIVRTFLNEEVALYRTDDGRPIALTNSCPHRFAALGNGKVRNDALACPYHGLRFGPDGKCVHNPHGPISGAMRVDSYPLHETYGVIWIWMGNSTQADPELLPDTSRLTDPEIDWVRGSLHVKGNYQLVIDNLLDLSHVEFLHPFLAVAEDDTPIAYSAEQRTDGGVTSHYIRRGSMKAGVTAALWKEAPDRIDMTVQMTWRAPANLYQENMFAAPDGSNVTGGPLFLPAFHLITPESAQTSHYLWAVGRNMMCGNEIASAGVRQGIEGAFMGEDEPMIADVQQRMGDRALMEMKPLLLSIDKAAVLARRAVDARLRSETKLPMSA